jgi:hypothetical protein
MALYHGRKARVLASTTGSGTANVVVGLREWTYDRSVDTVETTSFGDTNKTYVQGLPDAKGTFSGFWSDSDTTIFTGSGSADGVKLYMYPDYTNAPTKYVYGPAWLSASLAAAVDGAVTIEASFVANGAWGSFV